MKGKKKRELEQARAKLAQIGYLAKRALAAVSVNEMTEAMVEIHCLAQPGVSVVP